MARADKRVMMIAIIAVGVLNLIGLAFVLAAGVAAKRPMPRHEASEEGTREEYVVKPRPARPLLVPAVSH